MVKTIRITVVWSWKSTLVLIFLAVETKVATRARLRMTKVMKLIYLAVEMKKTTMVVISWTLWAVTNLNLNLKRRRSPLLLGSSNSPSSPAQRTHSGLSNSLSSSSSPPNRREQMLLRSWTRINREINKNSKATRLISSQTANNPSSKILVTPKITTIWTCSIWVSPHRNLLASDLWDSSPINSKITNKSPAVLASWTSSSNNSSPNSRLLNRSRVGSTF